MRIFGLISALVALGVAFAIYAAHDEGPEGREGHQVSLTAEYDASLDRRTNTSAAMGGENATAGGRIMFRFASPDQAAILAERGESGDVPAAEAIPSGALVNTTSPSRKVVTLDDNGTAMLHLDSNNDWVMALRFTSADVGKAPPGVCDENQTLFYDTGPRLHLVSVAEVVSGGQVVVPFGGVCAGP